MYYSGVILSAMAYQITGVSIVYSTVWSGANQRKHQSSASLAFVSGIHRWPVNSTHKGSVTRKMFPFDDVIMVYLLALSCNVIMYTFVLNSPLDFMPMKCHYYHHMSQFVPCLYINLMYVIILDFSYNVIIFAVLFVLFIVGHWLCELMLFFYSHPTLNNMFRLYILFIYLMFRLYI